jgi:hypothetical protein
MERPERALAKWMDAFTRAALLDETTARRRLMLVEWALLALVTRLDEEGSLVQDSGWPAKARAELAGETPASPQPTTTEEAIRAHWKQVVAWQELRGRG